MMILVLGFLFVCFILFLIKFLHEVWWNPIRIQSSLRSQGIRGPSYTFFHGNSKEIVKMLAEARATSLELSQSHQPLSVVQPHYYRWTKLHGKNFIHWHGPRPQSVVSEPNLAKEILNSKDELCPKPEFESYLKRLFGDGLVTTRGEKWYRQRKLANHAFHGENLKGMIPAMIASTEMMLERWKKNEGKEIEVYQEFKLLTSEIISRTAFGSSYLDGQQIFNMLGRLILILHRNSYRVIIPGLKYLIKTKDDRESEKLEQGMRKCILKMVKKREEEAKIGEMDSFGNDYLGVLMKATKESDTTKKISIDDIVDECKTFYIAGHETTASALTWVVFLLSIHTDWQETARNEVLHFFGRGNPTLDDISKLKIMSMIVNETLRLYAPITNLIREVKKGSRLGKLQAPDRMDLLIPPLAVHYDPEIWGEDADMFKPERFGEGVAKATKNNIAAFLPFGLGPRNCVGMNFALAETKIALSMILQHYTFTLSPTYVHSPTVLIGICPQKGLQINLQPLSH